MRLLTRAENRAVDVLWDAMVEAGLPTGGDTVATNPYVLAQAMFDAYNNKPLCPRCGKDMDTQSLVRFRDLPGRPQIHRACLTVDESSEAALRADTFPMMEFNVEIVGDKLFVCLGNSILFEIKDDGRCEQHGRPIETEEAKNLLWKHIGERLQTRIGQRESERPAE